MLAFEMPAYMSTHFASIGHKNKLLLLTYPDESDGLGEAYIPEDNSPEAVAIEVEREKAEFARAIELGKTFVGCSLRGVPLVHGIELGQTLVGCSLRGVPLVHGIELGKTFVGCTLPPHQIRSNITHTLSHARTHARTLSPSLPPL
jgi:hypothetical protein